MTAAVNEVNRHALETRARQSAGASNHAIYSMVARALDARRAGGELFVDVGCGTGNLWPYVRGRFARYAGVDAVRYEGLPAEIEWSRADLDSGRTPLADDCADVVVSVETIEHLENPRAFMRELVRVAKPGGLIVVTTPNQLSLLSLLTLVFKHRFAAFQDVHYPAHLSALLESDLRRIAAECALRDVEIDYSREGRIVFTPRHYPRILAQRFPRALSDNLLLIGRKQN